MKVHLKPVFYGPEKRFAIKRYDVSGPPAFCCERASNEWGTILDLGLRSEQPEIKNFCVIFKSAYIEHNGDVLSMVTPIDHCPWCGSHIVVVDDGATTFNPENN